MSLLDRIVEEKKKRLGSVKGKGSLRDLQSRITDSEKPRPFKEAVRRETGQIRLIAEIKKASPSRGTIRENFDLLGIARIYEDKAVDAISVVTEEDFFSGVLDALPTVKEAVTRPVLRKDFLFDEYQMYESRAFGADAVLFIASLLGRAQAEEYLHLCKELGLSVLFEVHGPDDLEKALRVGADIIGINNRDLKTLTLDLDTTFMLKKEIPSDKIIVSESGVKTRDDVSRLDQAGIDAMLVGTTLMESRDIGKKIDELWAHGLARI